MFVAGSGGGCLLKLNLSLTLPCWGSSYSESGLVRDRARVRGARVRIPGDRDGTRVVAVAEADAVPAAGAGAAAGTRFSDPPAFRRARRLSRLRSGSPPCGGVWCSLCSVGFGHLRASRRPAWWLSRSSPGRASSGFSVVRVREPGTAEREPARLRPEGDRRMPGTRPSCP
jgi:hypothetical protein